MRKYNILSTGQNNVNHGLSACRKSRLRGLFNKSFFATAASVLFNSLPTG